MRRTNAGFGIRTGAVSMLLLVGSAFPAAAHGPAPHGDIPPLPGEQVLMEEPSDHQGSPGGSLIIAGIGAASVVSGAGAALLYRRLRGSRAAGTPEAA